MMRGRRVRRWLARRRSERFFSRIAATIAKEDPAAEHYYWKLVVQRQTRFHEARRGLVDAIGPDVADALLRGLARRSLSAKRVMLLTPPVLYVAASPLGMTGLRGAIVVFGVPLALIFGYGSARNGHKRAGALLCSENEHPLDVFAAPDVERAVRRFRRYVPARALVETPHRALVAYTLGESDPDTLEIAAKLATEFDGTALDLLDAARRLG